MVFGSIKLIKETIGLYEEYELGNISGMNLIKIARAKLETEADKCAGYCLNCHEELHDREGWVHEDGKTTPKEHITT